MSAAGWGGGGLEEEERSGLSTATLSVNQKSPSYIFTPPPPETDDLKSSEIM